MWAKLIIDLHLLVMGKETVAHAHLRPFRLLKASLSGYVMSFFRQVMCQPILGLTNRNAV